MSVLGSNGYQNVGKFDYVQGLVKNQDKQNEVKTKEFLKEWKKTITKDELALSRINNPYQLQVEFENCINSCKAIIFQRVSMPQYEKLLLQRFYFADKIETITKHKLQQYFDPSFKVGKIVTSLKDNVIAYHNNIYLMMCHVTLDKKLINDGTNNANIIAERARQEQQARDQYFERGSKLVFQYYDYSQRSQYIKAMENFRNQQYYGIRHCRNNDEILRQWRAGQTLMITKEVKYFYYDLLRQRVDFFTTPLTDKNISLTDEKHFTCFDEGKGRSTGGEYNTRSVHSNHGGVHHNAHNDEKNMEAFNVKKIIQDFLTSQGVIIVDTQDNQVLNGWHVDSTTVQPGSFGFFLRDLGIAERCCASSCGSSECGGSCRVIELKDLINIYEEREVSMQCTRLSEYFDSDLNQWFKIYYRNAWFRNEVNEDGEIVKIHNKYWLPPYLRYLQDPKFDYEILPFCSCEQSQTCAICKSSVYQQQIAKADNSHLVKSYDEIKAKQNPVTQQLYADDEIVLVQHFVLKKNNQQSIWLDVAQMSDFAPKYKRVLLRREIEQNGFVNFVSHNVVSFLNHDHKVARLDCTVSPTDPASHHKIDSQMQLHDRYGVMAKFRIVDECYYDYGLMWQIWCRELLAQEAEKSIFYPGARQRRSQMHFVMENVY